MEVTSKEMQDLVAKTVMAALEAANKPNAIEQRRLDEMIEADKRRTKMAAMFAKIQADAEKAKKEGCSHSVWPLSAGRLAGHNAPRGQGQYCTGGQIHGNGNISILCLRCCLSWTFKATNEELQAVNDSGLLGSTPPPPERCIKTCGYCNQDITGEKEYRKHVEICTERPAKKAS